MSRPQDFHAGEAVRYIPNHAHGDSSHPDCENGIVSGVNDFNVFVRYYHKNGGLRLQGQATYPDDLIKT